MSITTETNRLAFVGDGNDNSPYAISMPLRDVNSVEMFFTTDATGAEASKTEGVDYTIALAADFVTATLTLITTAPATGETMVIRSDEPITRLPDYANFDGQPSATMNSDFDKGTMKDRTLREQLDRAVLVSKGHPNASLPLTPLILKGNAGKTIVVNSGETDFELLLDSIADGTITPAKLLDGSADNQVIQYDSGLGEWEYRSNLTVPGTLAVAGAVTLSVTLTVTGAATLSSTLVVVSTLTVNSNTDGTTILGRAKIGSPITDVMFLSHFNRMNTTDFALSQTNTGALVKVNSATGGEVRITNNDVEIAAFNSAGLAVTGAFSVSTVSNLTGDVTVITGDLDVTTGNVSMGGTLTVGDGVGDSDINLDGAVGNTRAVQYRSAGLLRAGVGISNVAEGGSDAGSDYLINMFDDAGAFLDTPLLITRSNSNVKMSSLAGTGSRTVVAAADGTLSAP